MMKRLALLALLLPLLSAAGCSLYEGENFDCADFSSQAAAQDFYEEEGGPIDDPHALDMDRDGLACEDELP